jgi:ubiquinone/menaquinone biosynthesis C-methylase UbiE
MSEFLENSPKDPTSHLRKVKDFHDQDAEQYRRLRYHIDSCEGLAYVTRRELVLGSLNHKPAKILDIGCGPGILTEDLVNRKLKVYSADLSFEMLKQAKQRISQNALASNASFAVSDISSMPFSANEMDVVLCIGVMCYVRDYNSVLSEIHRVLRQDGETIIQINKIRWPGLYRKLVPLYRGLKSRLTGKRYEGLDFEFNYFDYRVFLREVEAKGFKISDLQCYDFRIPFIDILLPEVSVKTGKFMFEHRHWGPFKHLAHGVLIRAAKNGNDY